MAGWREALLAQAVLAGQTTGYRSHPQLARFRTAADPRAAIGAFLRGLHDEATTRGYRFDGSKILSDAAAPSLFVTDGQLAFEWQHLGVKLARRSPEDAARWRESVPRPHPMFTVIPGSVEGWERP